MIKPIRLLDDLLGGDISLQLAVKWYGDLPGLLHILVHLEKDECIELIEVKDETRRKMEAWEIAELKRTVDAGAAEFDPAQIWIVLTEKGGRLVS